MYKTLVEINEFHTVNNRLLQFYAECRKSGISSDQIRLCFNEVLSDLDRIDMCDHYNDLHNPAYYDPKGLHIGQGMGYYKKPKIDIHASITSKGNLSICWAPRGYFTDEGQYEDFLYFDTSLNRWQRPNHELMFIRGFTELLYTLRDKDEPQSWLASHLMNACRAAVSMLYTRLDFRYDVRYVENLLFTTSSKSNIVDAEITNVANYIERAARSADQNDFVDFDVVCGFSTQDLITTIANVGTKTATGKDIAPNSYTKYLLQDLRKNGRNTSAAKLSRGLELAQKFLPDFHLPYPISPS